MDVQVAEKQYRQVHGRIQRKCEWMKSLPSPDATLDLETAEKEYRDVCSRAQPDSGWMTAQQLRVDLVRQEHQNHMLRSATCQLLSAQSDLKEELDRFRQEYFTRGHEQTPRTKKMDDINRAMVEERLRWERERQALSEQLAQMMTAFKGVQHAPSVQPVATCASLTQTSAMRTPTSQNASRSGALTPRDEDVDILDSGSPSEEASSVDNSMTSRLGDSDGHLGSADLDGHLGSAEETMVPQRRSSARKARRKKRTRAERVRKRARDSDSSSGEEAPSDDLADTERDLAGLDSSAASMRSGSRAKRVKPSATSDSSFGKSCHANRRQRTIASDSSFVAAVGKSANASKQRQASDSSFAPGRPSRTRGKKASLIESDSSCATPPAAVIESNSSFAAAEPAGTRECRRTSVGKSGSPGARGGGKKHPPVTESDSSFAPGLRTQAGDRKRPSAIESDSSFAPGIPTQAAGKNKKKKASVIESDSSFASDAAAPDCDPRVTSPAAARRVATLTVSPNASAGPLSHDDTGEFLRQVAGASPQAAAATIRSPVVNLHSPGVSPKLSFQTVTAREAFGALLPSPIIEEEEELSSARGPSRLLQASSASPVIQSTPLKRRLAEPRSVSPSPLVARKARKTSGRSLVDSSATSLGSPSPGSRRSKRGSGAGVRSPADAPPFGGPASVLDAIDETPFTSPGLAESPAPSFNNASRTTCETVMSPGAASTTTAEALSPQHQAEDDYIDAPHGMFAATSLTSIAEATLESLASVTSAGDTGAKSKSKVRRSLQRSKSISATLSKILPVGKSGKQTRRLSREGAAPAPPTPAAPAAGASLSRRTSLRLSRSSKDKSGDGPAKRGRISSATESSEAPAADLGRRKSLRRGVSFRVMPSFPEVPAKSRFAVSAEGEEDGEEDDDMALEADGAPVVDPTSFTPISAAAATDVVSSELAAPSMGDLQGTTPSPNGCISFGPRRPAKASAGKPVSAVKRRTANHSQRIAKLLDSVQRTPSFITDPAAAQAAALLPEKPSAVVWQVAEADDAHSSGDGAGECASPLAVVCSEESLCPVAATAAGDYDDDDAAAEDDALGVLYDNDHQQLSPTLWKRRHSDHRGKRSASASEVLDVETPGSKRQRRERCDSSDTSPITSPVIIAPDDTAPLHETNGRKRARSVSHKAPAADPSAAAQSSENAPQRTIRRGIKRSKSLKVGGKAAAAAASMPSETPRTGKVVRDSDGFEVPGALADSIQKAGKQPSVEKRRRLSRMLASAPAMSPVPNKSNGVSRRRSILRNASSRESIVSMGDPAANSTRLSMDGTATGDGSRRQSVAFSMVNTSLTGTVRRRALFSQRDNSFRGDVSLQSGVFGGSMAAAGRGGGRKSSAGESSSSLTQKQSMQMMMGLFRSGFKAPTVRGAGAAPSR